MRHSGIWCDVVWQLSLRINLRPQFSGPHIAWKMKAAGTSAVFLTIYQTTRPHIAITNCEHAGLLCEDGACCLFYGDASITRWLYDIQTVKWKGTGRKLS